MDNDLIKRLKEIKIENIVFSIFIILLLLAYYANDKEIDYFINKNPNSKETYYYLMIFIFIIVVIINLYYILLSYNEVKNLTPYDSYKKKKYAKLNLIASTSALVAALILLYIAITDTDIEAEISL